MAAYPLVPNAIGQSKYAGISNVEGGTAAGLTITVLMVPV